jgi:hypothetical protein
MQIIVLGMHRAGTSLTARMINMMGAYFAPEGLSLGFSNDNPKGFWERKDILQINKALLHHFGCTWYKVDHWDDKKLDTIPEPWSRNIRNTILELDAHRPWMIKDPRLCMTFPCWRPWLEVPVAVIACREPLEVARSLELRNGMPMEYGLALWEYHAVHIIRHTHDLPRVFTSYETMLSRPVENIFTLYEALREHGVQGLRLPSEREILSFVEPKLQRAHIADVDHVLTEEQKTLAAILCGEAMFDPNVKVSAHARRIMETLGPKISGAPINS